MKVIPQPWIAAIWMLIAVATSVVSAQQPLRNAGVFQLHRADMPPGVVGQGQLLRGGPLAGYFQPVAIGLPGAAHVAIWNGREFQPLPNKPVLLGMQIGQVYRLRISQIDGHPEAEVYPTIELVNRLYPPRGLELKFPVPIVFAKEEVEFAIRGQFVTRVVYLENPDQALPVQDRRNEQRVFEVGLDEDPLQTADALGRPMAIVRIGSRVPDTSELEAFGFGAPPFQVLAAPVADGNRNDAGIERAVEKSANVPRLPLGGPIRR